MGAELEKGVWLIVSLVVNYFCRCKILDALSVVECLRLKLSSRESQTVLVSKTIHLSPSSPLIAIIISPSLPPESSFCD